MEKLGQFKEAGFKLQLVRAGQGAFTPLDEKNSTINLSFELAETNPEAFVNTLDSQLDTFVKGQEDALLHWELEALPDDVETETVAASDTRQIEEGSDERPTQKPESPVVTGASDDKTRTIDSGGTERLAAHIQTLDQRNQDLNERIDQLERQVAQGDAEKDKVTAEKHKLLGQLAAAKAFNRDLQNEKFEQELANLHLRLANLKA
ncbi:hypothetical protein [Yoonia sp. BS5-3]|uniref:Uncharacterized protein n=1 Tax=Yoonia phaeophyticola TaxID=3137369 RepID=A0ABZ2V269_9RHOB